MCRAIVYLGKQTKMHPFTHLAHNSLVNQSVNPQYMSHGLNLTGNGFISWNHQGKKVSDPILYKSRLLPAYDYVYDMQTKMIDSNCFISHIRGGPLSSGVVLTTTNAHPFYYEGAAISLAHNGGLYLGNIEQQQKILEKIYKHISPKWFSKIRGTTDTEYFYALLLTRLDDFNDMAVEDALPEALLQTFEIIANIRRKAKVYFASQANLFISNGHFICAVRYTFDFGLFDGTLSRARASKPIIFQ